MPSPYGKNRNAAQYYQYGGVPQHYVYNWDGVAPIAAHRAAESQALSGGPGGDYIEVAQGPDVLTEMGQDDFIDVVAAARLRKSLGDAYDGLGNYPVAMTMQSGAMSVRHSGMEQGKMSDALGALSDNEKRFLQLAGVGAVGWLLWKNRKKLFGGRR